MSRLGALPTAVVAARIFPLLDFASWCRLARIDSRHLGVSRLPLASPIEFAITGDTPDVALHRPNLRPRVLRVDHDRKFRMSSGGAWVSGGGHGPPAFRDGVRSLFLTGVDPLLWLCGPRLTRLRLGSVDRGDWFRAIKACRALTDLEVIAFADIDDPFADMPTNAPLPAGLWSLRVALSAVTPTFIAMAADECTQLETLRVQCPRYAECMAGLAFPSLTRLTLANVDRDIDAVAMRLATHRMPQLRRLKLSALPGTVALRRLGAAFPRLEAVDLRGNGRDGHDKIDAPRSSPPIRGMPVSGTPPAFAGVARSSSSSSPPSSSALSPLSPLPSVPPSLTWFASLQSVGAMTLEVADREYPLASLTELHLSVWRDAGFSGYTEALPRLRHLVLSRYSPPPHASSPFLASGLGDDAAAAAKSWRNHWHSFIDPIVAVATNLQTLEVHCLSPNRAALGEVNALGASRCIHVPTLIAHLRSPPPSLSSANSSSSSSQQPLWLGAATVAKSSSICFRYNEERNDFAPCTTLLAERALQVHISAPFCQVSERPHRV